jgi:hypothetical protein
MELDLINYKATDIIGYSNNSVQFFVYLRLNPTVQRPIVK